MFVFDNKNNQELKKKETTNLDMYPKKNNQLYHYYIGTIFYDASTEFSLIHSKKFTKKEFEDIFVESVLKILLDNREKYPQLAGWEEGDVNEKLLKMYEEILEKELDSEPPSIIRKYTSIDDIISDVVQLMCNDYGFSTLKYDQEIAIFNNKITQKDEEIKQCKYSHSQLFQNRDMQTSSDILKIIRKKYWERRNEQL